MSKTILVDMDGPVYPWVEHMAIMLVAHGFTQYDSVQLMDLYKSWNIWDDWGIPKGEFDLLWDRWIQDGTFYSGRITKDKWLEPVPGAREGMWKLHDAGWEIHIVTARLDRPGHQSKSIISTIEWLKKCVVPYDTITFVNADKSMIEADAILDDKASHLTESLCPERYLFPAKHNTNDRQEEEYMTLDRENPWADLVATLCYDEDDE